MNRASNHSFTSAVAKALNKPYYWLRPRQVARRVNNALNRRRPVGELDEIVLPWGYSLRFRANDKMGLCLARRGVFDLAVCETLWRLTDRGEFAVDVGANVGQMTSVLAAAVGPGGHVTAFEPHPEIFRQLSANAECWKFAGRAAAVELCNEGASSVPGVAELTMTESFTWNNGTASIAGGTSHDAIVESITVPVVTLDVALTDRVVGVMKLDVEGHELEVLHGARQLLAAQRIRDILFEDFGTLPTPVSSMLEDFGYAVFSVDQGTLGPVLAPARNDWHRKSTEDPSYLLSLIHI